MSGLGRAPAPVALVDDNVHSARLLLRTLAGRGCRARWLGNGERAARSLEAAFQGAEAPPELVVVDLKSRTGASAEFIARFAKQAHANGTMMVAMAPSLAAEHREAALRAGAAAVFQRHANRADYHREICAMMEFWGRKEGPEEVSPSSPWGTEAR